MFDNPTPACCQSQTVSQRLTEGLRGRGYTEPDIRKIAGENFLRVLEQNESKR